MIYSILKNKKDWEDYKKLLKSRMEFSDPQKIEDKPAKYPALVVCSILHNEWSLKADCLFFYDDTGRALIKKAKPRHENLAS